MRFVEVQPAKAPYSLALRVTNLFEGALSVLALLLASILIVRRWRDPAALALASALLVGAAGLSPMQPPPGVLGAVVIVWFNIGLPTALIMLIWVALLMAPTQGRAYRWIARCCIGLTVALVLWTIVAAWYFLGNALPGAQFIVSRLRPTIQTLGLALCVVAYIRAWRLVEAGQRERLRWLFLGLASGVLSVGFTVATFVADSSVQTFLIVSFVADALAAAALVILAYAILGQRVTDVGFAINRAIARAVQHVFFRSWHVRSEALDRFLETSEHFTDPGALAHALLEALDAYTESVGSALYGRDSQGRFVLTHTTLPGAASMLGANDLMVVKLRASPTKPLLLDAPTQRNVENWAFPLARRGELIGFVRIGEKRNLDVYRPDQIERVSRTVRRVGFDLYALRLEQATATRGIRVAPEPRPVPSL